MHNSINIIKEESAHLLNNNACLTRHALYIARLTHHKFNKRHLRLNNLYIMKDNDNRHQR